MYLTEQYWMYRLAYHLVTEEKYEIIHINHRRNEVWLEKQNRKHSQIIRFLHHGFDWKNHLKSDIASVFQRVKNLKQYFIGKTIQIYNVYISAYDPVDDWEALKKPMMLKEKKPVKMNVFYLTEENYLTEESRLFKKINISKPDKRLPEKSIQEQKVSFYKSELTDRLQDKRKEYETIFSYGKPRFTYILIVLNLLLFIYLELNGGSMNMETLIEHGAKYNPLIINGEWWRLVTSMFLHIGMLHLVMNMIALYYLGHIVERIYGSVRYLIIYFIAGIVGSLTSFAFSVNVSAGASGALFGLFGALLFFGMIHKRLFLQTMGKSVILILIFNLIVGLFLPAIDMGAHLGGLIGGFLTSGITFLPNKKHVLLQILMFFCIVVVILFLIIYGFSFNMQHLK